MIKNMTKIAIPAVAAAGAGFFAPMLSGMLPKSFNRPISLAVLGVLCIYLGRKKPILVPVGYGLLALAAASQARGGNMAGGREIKVISPNVLGTYSMSRGATMSRPISMSRGATMSRPAPLRGMVYTR